MALVKNRLLRSGLFILGILSVILGLVGAFLPVLPATPFILLAAWCFLKSSPKAHAWIYSHRLFGKALRDWEQNRAIARPTKAVALLMILLSLILLWLRVNQVWVRYSVTVLLILVSIFITTRNETK